MFLIFLGFLGGLAWGLYEVLFLVLLVFSNFFFYSYRFVRGICKKIDGICFFFYYVFKEKVSVRTGRMGRVFLGAFFEVIC